MMQNQYQSEWLRLLRGGEFAQGDGKMKRGHQYCCMGVVAEVNGCLVLDEDQGDARLGVVYGVKGSGGYVGHTTLPHDLLQKLHITEDDCQALANMNDTWHFSFSVIADVLSESWARDISVVDMYEFLMELHQLTKIEWHGLERASKMS